VAGFASEGRIPPWTATISVQGNEATLAVDVPGQTVGKDYHPHISLDDGPVAMIFTPTHTFANLQPAHHKVVIVIADPAHIPIKGMQRTLEFGLRSAWLFSIPPFRCTGCPTLRGGPPCLPAAFC
jgi:hypothetical protein